jgi:hypothetical protein
MTGGRYARNKGKRGEREVATILRAHGYDVRRGWQSRAGSDDADVIGVPGWWVEVSIGGANPRRKYAQAVEASAKSGRRPVAITRPDGGEWLATVALCDWLRLVALLHGTVEQSRCTLAADPTRTRASGEGGEGR